MKNIINNFPSMLDGVRANIDTRKDIKKANAVTKRVPGSVSHSETKVYMYGTGYKFINNPTRDKNGNPCVVIEAGIREPLVVFLRPDIKAVINDGGNELLLSRINSKANSIALADRAYLQNIKAYLISKKPFNKFAQAGMWGDTKPPLKPVGKKESQQK